VPGRIASIRQPLAQFFLANFKNWPGAGCGDG